MFLGLSLQGVGYLAAPILALIGEWDLARGEDEAEVGLRPSQVEDGERERDGSDRPSEQGDGAAGEEEAKVALAQGSEVDPQRQLAERFSAQRASPAYDCQNGIARS